MSNSLKKIARQKKPQVNSTSKGQPFLPENYGPPTVELKNKHFSHDARISLSKGLCPYCDTDEVNGMLFGDSDGREGGFLDCRFCGVSISWIDSPFEASEVELTSARGRN
jgi:hypothetical protein